MEKEKLMLNFQADKALLDRLDDFRLKARVLTRSEAIRRLLDEALKNYESKKQPRKKD
ncbi:MAG TPA: ribbon-helix-helix protein, CopG family [Syntrophales bacterium]|nr:ribbon-helix-helix protein, CopG family [Syntrophales bacterium]